jgi:hypothetical protein
MGQRLAAPEPARRSQAGRRVAVRPTLGVGARRSDAPSRSGAQSGSALRIRKVGLKVSAANAGAVAHSTCSPVYGLVSEPIHAALALSLARRALRQVGSWTVGRPSVQRSGTGGSKETLLQVARHPLPIRLACSSFQMLDGAGQVILHVPLTPSFRWPLDERFGANHALGEGLLLGWNQIGVYFTGKPN